MAGMLIRDHGDLAKDLSSGHFPSQDLRGFVYL